jgi:hypothetical protein
MTIGNRVRYSIVFAIAAVFFPITALFAQVERSPKNTTYNFAKLPPQKHIPLIVDPDSNIAQGLFANTAKGGIVNVDNQGWVGPEGAGIFLGDAHASLSEAGCVILVKNEKTGKPLLLSQIECKVGNLWYSAVRSSDIDFVDSAGKPIVYSVAEFADGGFQSLRIASNSMTTPAQWKVSTPYDKVSKTIDIEGLGKASVYALARLGSVAVFIQLTPDETRPMAKWLTPSDQKALAALITGASGSSSGTMSSAALSGKSISSKAAGFLHAHCLPIIASMSAIALLVLVFAIYSFVGKSRDK